MGINVICCCCCCFFVCFFVVVFSMCFTTLTKKKSRQLVNFKFTILSVVVPYSGLNETKKIFIKQSSKQNCG